MKPKGMIVKLGVLAVGCWILSTSALAGEFQRTNVHLNKVTAIAALRPALPGSQRYYRVYVNAASWGASTCRPDAFDVRMDDVAILNVLQQTTYPFNLQSNEVAVEDTLRPIDSTCQAVWASGTFFNTVP